MELPPALAPWAAHLELFPRDLALSLGPMLRRLDAAIGPLRAHGRRGGEEPDGFAGLARRGPYERLLLSEWLLAEEEPVEFLRRAAMGEHAFLELARLAPAGKRRCVAIFDAGPEQIGAPRLAHLAALIVLARRAEAAGAEFQWWIAQRPEAPAPASVTQAGVRDLLLARTAAQATDTGLEACRRGAGSEHGRDDVWIVGSPRLARLPASAGASLLEVEEAPEPGERALRVRVAGPGRAAREVRLVLPEGETCTRLLRDPFRAVTVHRETAEASVRAASNLVFTATGTKLLARTDAGALVSYPIPNSPRAPAGRPRVYRPSGGHPILAAGRYRKSLVAVLATADPMVLRVEALSRRARGFPSGEFRYNLEPVQVEAGGLPPLGPCYFLPSFGRPESPMFALPGTTLVRLPPPDPSSALFTAPGTAALAPVPNGVAWSLREDDVWHLFTDQGEAGIVHSEFRAGGTGACFGYPGNSPHPDWGLCALQVGPERWLVLDGRGDEELYCPSRYGGPVGIISTDNPLRVRGLVMLDLAERNLVILGRTWTHDLPLAPAKIAEAAVSPVAPHIAYLTVEGELFIYSLTAEAVVYRLAPDGGNPEGGT